MTTVKTTLATDVAIITADGVTRQKDVPVEVLQRRGHVFVTFGWATRERVTVMLTEAERIAFIEALGGVAKR